MDFVSHQEINLILICRSGVQLICVYDVYLGVPFHSIAYNLLYLRNVSYRANYVAQFSCTFKTKVFAEEAMPGWHNRSKGILHTTVFERYKGELVLRLVYQYSLPFLWICST